jgi:hypothetical protein
MSEHRDLFHIELSRGERDYSVIHAGIFPRPGVELDIAVHMQESEQSYTYTLSMNPCLEIPWETQSLAIIARTNEGDFQFHYSYEDLLVGMRTEAQMRAGGHRRCHLYSLLS